MRVVWPIQQVYLEHNQYPGVMYISALLRRHGIEVEVVEADYDAVAARLRSGEPTVLAYSTPTSFFHYYLELSQALKKRFPSVLSVFGGPHPTYFPEIIANEGIDAVCVGEGEYPMLDLLTALDEGKAVTEIPNWWIKADGKVYKNAVRPLLENLDELPIPDHELFRRAVTGPVSQALVLTSRGCPHRCTYCFNHIFRELYRGKGPAVRRRSVEHVMEELRGLKAAGCEYIRFMDDLFILSADWIAEFSRHYPRQIGLPFSCLVRANYVTDAIISDLKTAGCFRILMSIETGNDELRNSVLKRNMSREVMIDAALTIKKHGIRLVTANILAIPGGSFSADWETLEMNIRCRPHFASVSILHPYPRTEIFQYAVSNGFLDSSRLSEIEASFGFPLTSSLRFSSEAEKLQMENLHKLFTLAVALPWLAPIVKWLVKLPPNRLFNLIYTLSFNYGNYLRAIPMRLGLRLVWRRAKSYRWVKASSTPSGPTDPKMRQETST